MMQIVGNLVSKSAVLQPVVTVFVREHSESTQKKLKEHATVLAFISDKSDKLDQVYSAPDLII